MGAWPRIVVVAAWFAAWPAAHAQLAPDTLRDYGGRYSLDCTDATKPSVSVTADAMVVEQGTQRMTGGSLQASFSAFGQGPPEGFLVMLVSTLRGGPELDALVMADDAGPYLSLQGDARVARALGALAQARFRDCDAARARRVIAQRAADRATTRRDAAERSANAKGGFGRAWRAAIGPLAKERWIAEVAGYPVTDESTTRIDGAEYRFERACKPHDCFDNNLIVVWSATTGAVYGKVLVAGQPTFIGRPPPAMQTALETRWRAEWRQGR